MTSSDSLYQLIKSLTKTEKKYFKDFSGQGNYIRLFDAINAQDEYNEAEILRKFSNEPFAKNFSVAKNYLFEAVLRAMRAYNAGRLMDDVSYERLQNLKLLNEKGLHNLVEKQLLKLKAFCYEYELYPRLLEVLTFETTFNQVKMKSNQTIHGERLKVLQGLTNTISINMVYEELLEIATKHDKIINEALNDRVEQLMQHPLLADEKFLLLNDELYAFYNVFFVYHYLRGQYRMAYNFKRKQFNLYRHNQAFIKTRPKAQLLMMANMASMAYNIPDADELEKCYNEMLEHQGRVPGFEALKFEQRIALGLLLFKSRNNYSAIGKLVNDVNENLPRYVGELTLVRELDIYFNMAVVFFHNRDFSNALDWLNRILNHPRIEERQQVHRYARIFELVLHFELSNYDLLDYKIVNTYRYLYKRQLAEPFDMAVLKGMKHILKSYDRNSRKESLIELVNALKEVPAAEYEKIANDQFDYIQWLREKLSQ